MDTRLAVLKQQGLLRSWSDREILSGQRISTAICTNQPEADIMAFLISPDFLASSECIKEWDRAKRLAHTHPPVFRVPIIVRECAWYDFLGHDDVKALPIDGKPIMSYPDPDVAWQEVYNGIKAIVEALRRTFSAKVPYIDRLKDAALDTPEPILLDDIFVFPRLVEQHYKTRRKRLTITTIDDVDELQRIDYAIVHGQEKAGKTTLAKHLTLSLIDDEQPVLLLDGHPPLRRASDKQLRRQYEDQFNGDYYLWKQQSHKTLILDNVSEAAAMVNFIVEALELFESIYLFVASDVFHCLSKR